MWPFEPKSSKTSWSSLCLKCFIFSPQFPSQWYSVTLCILLYSQFSALNISQISILHLQGFRGYFVSHSPQGHCYVGSRKLPVAWLLPVLYPLVINLAQLDYIGTGCCTGLLRWRGSWARGWSHSWATSLLRSDSRKQVIGDLPVTLLHTPLSPVYPCICAVDQFLITTRASSRK